MLVRGGKYQEYSVLILLDRYRVKNTLASIFQKCYNIISVARMILFFSIQKLEAIAKTSDESLLLILEDYYNRK